MSTETQDARGVAALPHRVRRVWIALSTSLWFIPATLVGASLLLAVLLVELSARVDSETLARYPRLFGAGAAGARGMLSTIAGSIITVAGVTFSITIAALALASAQYTPRVLRTFMADRANQLVLGTFVGVYTYCLVVLRTIRGGDEGAFVPSVAVLVGFALALLSVGVLIFFVHHIAAALQASTILDRVRLSTERAIAHLFPDDVAEPGVAAAAGSPVTPGARWVPVPSRQTGYLQSVDADGLVDLARAHAVVIRMDRAVGDFIAAGSPLISVTSDVQHTVSLSGSVVDSIADQLDGLYVIAAYRTVEQDAGFGFIQISDIALKALSAGVNDTTTAVTCVDHLSALLARLGPRRIPPRVRAREAHARVIASGPTYASLVSLALDNVRRNAAGNVSVLMRLYDALETASHHTVDPERRAVLANHVDHTDAISRASVPDQSDVAALMARAQAVRQLLAGPAPRTTTTAPTAT